MTTFARFWYRYASPASFYPLAGRLIPVFATLAVLLAAAGLYVGFFVAPTDWQQGEAYRIIYIHVPAAWMAMFVYLVMAFWSAISLSFHTRLSAMMAQALAPTGAMWAFIALWTGAFWGRPTWGAYWVWDARLTSTLILLFLYLGYMGLREAFDNSDAGSRAAAILAIVGVVNIPIIHYSVEWWHTLHQGATIFKIGRPSIAPEMLWPLLVMMAAYACLAALVVLMRTRNEVLERRLFERAASEQYPGARRDAVC